MISTDEKALIQTSIRRKIKSLSREIDELKEFTKPVSPENAIGRLSRMEAINNKSVAEASLRNCEHKLNKLNRALEQINNKHFGQCVKCKNDIPFKRLKLMPESSHCVNCAN